MRHFRSRRRYRPLSKKAQLNMKKDIRKWKLYDRREYYAKIRDRAFWKEYRELCHRYKRYMGGLSPERSFVTCKTAEEVNKKFGDIPPYSYSTERGKL